MTRRRKPDDDDDSDEYDLPDGVYHDDDDGLPTVPCPYCRAEILEDAGRCPRCENYISREDSPPQPRSRFVVIVMIFALVIAAYWALRP